jgi:hypothetical protein
LVTVESNLYLAFGNRVSDANELEVLQNPSDATYFAPIWALTLFCTRDNIDSYDTSNGRGTFDDECGRR